MERKRLLTGDRPTGKLHDDVLVDGVRRTRQIAQETMGMVYEAMGLYGPRLLKAYAMPLWGLEVPPLAYC